ncbi:putative homeodomain transcription factor isoform X1 [Trichogramma pretiosum]|uniref:putative homeodomain transcription factor isoform X1 n=1 Tax=Trichogramma pretiosum TaxID=7493 RepID=UPI0006C99413|nr:putative homeodomain transcription factor isoform X1 [Trichogramma pretiosum]
MALNKLIHRYQKKLGTYDKQEWEKTVEQKIFLGLKHVPMRAAKLKTEFIDVDLVRGSSFPKAKPKHGLVTVAYLAIQRLLFLPFTADWWIQQTSSSIYFFFLLLYFLQVFNLYLYFYHYPKDNKSDIVSMSEVLVPAVMMITLSMIHSQIVSTNSGAKIINKYDKKQVRKIRHGRSRLNKNRGKKNSSENENSRNFNDWNSDDNKSINSSATVKLVKKVVIKTSAISCSPKITSGISNSVMNHSNQVNTSSNSSIKSEKLIVEDQIDTNNEEHHEDDGFESLNGNASSDNDRETSCVRGEENLLNLSNEKDNSSIRRRPRDLIVFDDNSTVLENKCMDYNKSSTNEKEDNYKELSTETSSTEIKELFKEILTVKENQSIDDEEYDTSSSKQPSIHSFTGNEKKYESEEEGDCDETITNDLIEGTSSAAEWLGVTTNSDDCSYSSEFEESDHASGDETIKCGEFIDSPFSYEFELPPTQILSSNCALSDKVSCTIWTYRDVKKAELSVLDISSTIIARVESMPESMDYFYIGLFLSIILSLVPSLIRVSDYCGMEIVSSTNTSLLATEFSLVNPKAITEIIFKFIRIAFGSSPWIRSVILLSAMERFFLAFLLFFLLAVAERTFKQRLLYAKLFSHLTSSRRARKSELPHFRLNKVRNIKTWLSVRSYLKRRGPQRSVDVIISSVFVMTLALLSYVSLELIKDIDNLHSHYNIEALMWSFALGLFILRFMTLGTKINNKYRNLSILITEQINLYLQIEQKPHKKEELTVANNVLKLAADLIKELESPFKISGLSANPYLYTITKVVLLSALSGVLSELLGFKLKLHKIKIK